MTLAARLALHPEFTVGETDPRIYGSFIEHLGRAVYTGIYEPAHPLADEQGFRKDVLEMVRELEVPIVRYPGGNFVSGYNWEDGIGPRDKRPKRLDLAWATVDPNWVGVDEFADWARRANAEVMMAVNLGTRDVDAARNLVEYCNHPSGTQWSDLRIANGHPEPHKIKTWCLGNEMDGPWQIGAKSAADYGKTALAAGRAMKAVDPGIELVACGSSSESMATFPDWEATILDHLYDVADYVSLHQYFSKNGWNDRRSEPYGTPSYVAQSVRLESFIKSVVASCDHVKARKRARKSMNLSFDEWNIWHRNPPSGVEIPRASIAPPLLEDVYTFEDVILFGSMMLALLRHCDRVKIGCLAQLVNVIAPIMTSANGPAWRQTTFYPFLHGSKYGRGTVLDTLVVSPSYETAEWGSVPYVDALAVLNRNRSGMTVFAVNRSETQPALLTADLAGFGAARGMTEHIVMDGHDKQAANTRETPHRVTPRSGGESKLDGNQLTATLTPFSWNVLRIALN